VRFRFFLIVMMIFLMSSHFIIFSNAQGAPVTMPYVPNPKVVVDGTVEANEYKVSYTEPTTGITICWEHDGTNMYVALVSPGTGWVGIGFGPTGTGMDGANIIIGYVDDNGSVVLSDEYGQGLNHFPIVSHFGGKDDIISKAGSISNGKTTIEFVFPLNSGDQYHYALTPGGTHGFILAYQQSAKDLTTQHTSAAAGDFYVEASGVAHLRADFTYVLHGSTIDLTDNSSAQGGSITSWLWTFGDGASSTEQNTTHTFSTMNEYTVELKVNDSNGNLATKSQGILVPSKGDRLGIWSTQVAFVSAMIVLTSTFAVGLGANWRRKKKG
jgi:hypothetical protein